MKKFLILILSVAAFASFTGLCRAQSDAPYTEGPVWNVTMVKTKAGMTDEYLKELAKTLKASLVLLGNAATPQDFDILIKVESKNMAAQDNAREKFDPIARKSWAQPINSRRYK
jgi:hypothetical protein